MQFFLDTANINEIKALRDTGFVDGVTTNPSLIAKEGKDFLKTIEEICKIVSGPVSAEVAATDTKTMVEEGFKLASIADNVTIKVPLTEDGLRACRILSDEGIMVNVTLCFSPLQALMAAKAGATFISPFVGRLDDIGQDGIEMVSQVCSIYDNYPYIKTMVLAASLRHVKHVMDAAILGVDVVTVPPKLMHQIIQHPLTDKGLDIFQKDWAQSKQIILDGS